MDNELVNEVLTGLISTATEVKSFLVVEAPEIIQQLLVWTVWENAVYLSIATFFIAFTIWYVRLAYKKIMEWDEYEDKEMEQGFMLFTGIATILITLITTMHIPGYILEIIKIQVAPKVWLLEYASSLAK